MTSCTHDGCRVSCSSDSICGMPKCGNHICVAHAYPIDISQDDEEEWLLVCKSCSETHEAARIRAMGERSA